MIVIKILGLLIGGIVVFILLAFIRSIFLICKRPIRNIYNERKAEGHFCNYYDLPYKTIDFLLAFEDRNFFIHNGYDIQAIKNAFWFNIKSKSIKHGGSTITQQLIKNLYFNFKQRFSRKICELFISIYAEKKLSKIEIIELYLNIIYYGNEVYGLYDASLYYFNKKYQDLSVNQIFFLLSFLSAPTAANPYTHPNRFVAIRNKKVNQVLWLAPDRNYRKIILKKDIENLDPELIKRDVDKLNVKMVNEKYGV